ncbi:MAG: LuxR C-terminal-related transcriptional regulator [Acidobacteriota bacterium]
MTLSERLTPRELELAQAMHAGGTFATLAKQMGLSPNSVKIYASRIYDKLQIKGDSPRQQLVLMLEREKNGAAQVTQPSACAVLLTADRPEMTQQAVGCFRAQTYENKRLLIWESGERPACRQYCVEDPRIDYCFTSGYPPASVGSLRNDANYRAHADILIHFDSDDLSHPNRIAEQVALLQSSGADCVGYNEALFCTSYHHALIQDNEAYLYRNPNPSYAIGASLAYWRRTWQSKPFPDVSNGEDTVWLSGLKVCGVSGMEPDPRLICRIHGKNTSQKAYDALISAPKCEQVEAQWKRVPEWDSYCRKVAV